MVRFTGLTAAILIFVVAVDGQLSFSEIAAKRGLSKPKWSEDAFNPKPVSKPEPAKVAPQPAKTSSLSPLAQLQQQSEALQESQNPPSQPQQHSPLAQLQQLQQQSQALQQSQNPPAQPQQQSPLAQLQQQSQALQQQSTQAQSQQQSPLTQLLQQGQALQESQSQPNPPQQQNLSPQQNLPPQSQQPSQGGAQPQTGSTPQQPQQQGLPNQQYASPYQTPYMPYGPSPFQPYGQTPYQPYGQPSPYQNPYQPYLPYGQYPYQPNPFQQYPQPNPYQQNPQPNPYQQNPQPQPSPYQQNPQPNPYQQNPQPNPYQQYPQPNPYQQYPQPNPYQQYPQPNPYQQYPQPNPYQQYSQPNPYVPNPYQTPQYEINEPNKPISQEPKTPAKEISDPEQQQNDAPYQSTQQSAQSSQQMGHSQQGQQAGHSQQNLQTGHTQQGQQAGHSQQNLQTGHTQQGQQAGHSQQSQQVGRPQQNPQAGHSQVEQPQMVPKKTTTPNGCGYECVQEIKPVCAIRHDGIDKSFMNKCEFEGLMKCSPEIARQVNRVITGDCRNIPASMKKPKTEEELQEQAIKECKARRVCPYISQPFCVKKTDGTFENQSNECLLKKAVECDPQGYTNEVKSGRCGVAEGHACEPMMCGQNYDPVCGVAPDGTTRQFSNKCSFESHAMCNPKSFTRVVQGECPRNAQQQPEEQPMPQQQQPEVQTAPQQQECEPLMCGMDYNPVCAIAQDGSTQQFGNPCSLESYVRCNPRAFTQVAKGECPRLTEAEETIPTQNEQAGVLSQEQQCEPVMCGQDYSPVCGVAPDGSTRQFSNACGYEGHIRCHPTSFIRAVRGECAKDHQSLQNEENQYQQHLQQPAQMGYQPNPLEEISYAQDEQGRDTQQEIINYEQSEQ